MPDRIQGDAEVLVDRDGGVVVATLVGEIDMANATAAFGRIATVLQDEALALVLDLTPTRYLDSTGLQEMLNLHERTRARGLQMCVVAPDGAPPRRLIEVTGMHEKLELFPALHAAREVLGSG